jgi:hypothetical protein
MSLLKPRQWKISPLALLIAAAWLAFLVRVTRDTDAQRPGYGAITLLVLLYFAAKWPLFLAVINFLIVLIHELGHVLAATLVDFTCITVQVWRLRWDRERGFLRMRWTRGGEWYAGFVFALPRDMVNLRLRLTILTAGGPLANLLLTVAVIAYAWHLQLPPEPNHDPIENSIHSQVKQYYGPPRTDGNNGIAGWGVNQFMIALAGYSLFMGMANLFWLRTSDGLADGEQLRMLLRGGAASDKACLLAAIAGQSQHGISVRDWPEELIRRAIIPPREDPEQHQTALSTFFWLLSERDIAGAGWFLQRALTADPQLPAVWRAGLLDAAAYLVARFGGDLIVASSLLVRAQSLTEEKSAQLRLGQMAVHVAVLEGSEAGARGLQRFRAMTDERKGQAADADLDWLKQLAVVAAAL